MYKIVAPTVNEKVTINVPNHFPNKNPPTRNIGLANPSIIIQKIANKIKDIESKIKFEFLNLFRCSVLLYINS